MFGELADEEGTEEKLALVLCLPLIEESALFLG